jgi:hypothetical protein
MKCWKSKIEREDRVIKSRANQFGRTTLDKMLECIPVGMHDSFMKPHDIMDAVEARGRNAPRLYKYYLTGDIERIISEYEALTPAPFAENPTHTAEEKATALADHQALMDSLEDKRTAFFAEKKAENDEHMDQVKKIEAGIRLRRETNAVPYHTNRKARKELFTKRAEEEIGHIPTEFVQSTKAFKAATRIFRDGGTERGWQTLKPKIVTEWEASQAGENTATEICNELSPLGGTDDDDDDDDEEDDDDDNAEEDDEDVDPTEMSMSDDQSKRQSALTSHIFLAQSCHFQRLQNVRQVQQPQQALGSGPAVHNPYSSMRQMSNQSMAYSMAPSAARLTFPTTSQENSTVHSTMINLGRQSMHLSNNMLSNPSFGNHRPSYAHSSQHVSMNTNRDSLSSAQRATPNTKMSISSLIQQPTRNPFSDFDPSH